MQGQMYWLQGILYIFSFANSTQCTTETCVFLCSASVVKSNNKCVLCWGKPSIFTARPSDHQYSCFPFNEFRPQRRAWEDLGAFVFMPLIGFIRSFLSFTLAYLGPIDVNLRACRISSNTWTRTVLEFVFIPTITYLPGGHLIPPLEVRRQWYVPRHD